MSKKQKREEKEISRRLSLIEKTLEIICVKLERSHFYDYMEYVSNEKRIFMRSFRVGILKGIGSAIGFTLLGALVVYILHLLAQSNLPYIADFISNIIDIIERK